MNTSEQINIQQESPASSEDKVALIAELIYEIIEAESGNDD